MGEFIELLIANIVRNPEDVMIDVDEIEASGESESPTTEYKIRVNKADMGLVIGKEGKTINSIRNIARCKAIKENVMINIKLLESDGSEKSRS